MRTQRKTVTVWGNEIESWYNEESCNWEAFIPGSGSFTDPHDRMDAVMGVVELHNSTFCPSCKEKGKLGIFQRSDTRKSVVGLYCKPCGYAQSKGGRQWNFMVGGIACE